MPLPVTQLERKIISALAVLIVLGLIGLWRGFFVAAAAVISGLLLYGLDLHESANLWDCLIDFPSVVVSVVILVKGAIQRHHRPSFGDVQAGGGG